MNKPWENEPDVEVFVYLNTICAIVRHGTLKHLCGYMVIPSKSPDGHEIVCPSVNDMVLVVHGGITHVNYDARKFFNTSPAKDEVERLGLIPPEKSTIIGFDCAHSGDLTPGQLSGGGYLGGDKYRDIEYVRTQIKNLVEQVWDHILGRVVGD